MRVFLLGGLALVNGQSEEVVDESISQNTGNVAPAGNMRAWVEDCNKENGDMELSCYIENPETDLDETWQWDSLKSAWNKKFSPDVAEISFVEDEAGEEVMALTVQDGNKKCNGPQLQGFNLCKDAGFQFDFTCHYGLGDRELTDSMAISLCSSEPIVDPNRRKRRSTTSSGKIPFNLVVQDARLGQQVRFDVVPRYTMLPLYATAKECKVRSVTCDRLVPVFGTWADPDELETDPEASQFCYLEELNARWQPGPSVMGANVTGYFDAFKWLGGNTKHETQHLQCTVALSSRIKSQVTMPCPAVYIKAESKLADDTTANLQDEVTISEEQQESTVVEDDDQN